MDNLLKIARAESLKSDHPAHKLGAVLFKKQGIVIAKGRNYHKKTHPLVRRFDPHKTLHAEMAAILSVRHKHDLKGAKLLVYREFKSGELANARPCDVCAKIIKLFGIKEVWYTSDKGIIKEIL